MRTYNDIEIPYAVFQLVSTKLNFFALSNAIYLLLKPIP